MSTAWPPAGARHEAVPASTGAAATVLAVDLGTQSLRISALRTDGTRLWTWSAAVSSSVDDARVEQDPAQWEALLLDGLQAAHAAGVRPDALAVAGPLAGYVPLDAAGQALAPAAMYSDRRSAQDVARLEAMPGQAWPSRLLVSDPVPHWLRLQREAPGLAARTAHFLDATGWLNFYLSGQATLNAYTARRLYEPAQMAGVGAGGAPFGRAVPIGATLGSVRAAVGERWGWTGIPVIAATFDSKCAYIASGIAAAGEATDISGTVTSFGVVSEREVCDPLHRIYSVPLGARWLVRGSTACAGSALEWVRGQLLPQDFEALDAAAGAVAPGANGLSFLPYLAGERAPLWNPHARGALLGLGLHSTQADIARAVYEGIALSLGHIVQTMRACGVALHEVRLAGGLARNALLSQIKADVLGVPVVQLADHELTTLGLAVVASVALGAHADHASASRCFTRAQRRFVPDAQAVCAYQAVLARYVHCAQALAPTFTPTFTAGSGPR